MTVTPPSAPARRFFLGWDAPALPAAARVMAEHYESKGGLDLRRVVVVTPGARAGRRLGELLLGEAEARRVPLTPPQMVTTGRFPEVLYQGDLQPSGGTAARFAFAQAMRSMDPDELERVFPTLPGSMAGWLALAGVVEALHREVGAEGLDFHEVGRALRRGFPYDDTGRWEALGRVQDRYLEILGDSGLGDLDRERRRALEEGRVGSPGDIWLVGVVELPGVVRRMLQSLSGGIRALIHAPETLAQRFDPLGCVVPGEWEHAHVPLEEGAVKVVPRPWDQADAVAAILHGFGGRYGAEDVVVGVPDEDLVPYVERGLSMVGVPHRFAGGTPLTSTGPVPLLGALADYLEGRSFPAFAALIRHPDLGELLSPIQDEADVTGALAIADRYQSEHLQASVEGSLPGMDKAAHQMRRLLVLLEEALALEGLRGKRPVSGWMPLILERMVKVYGGKPLDLSNRRVRHLVECSSRVGEEAGMLEALPPALDLEVEASEALAVLLSGLRDDRIPPDPQEEAVELLGWLELPLDDAPAVILTGVNDRNIPESLGAHALLPGALRTHLGIPDDLARYARDAYLLSALLHSRETVHMVAGRSNAAGDPLRPSRLLFAGPDREVARRVLEYLDEETGGADEAEGKTPYPRPTQSRFRAPPQDPLLITEPRTRLRVTDFGRILNDPYRWVLEEVLKLAPLDDDAREMDGLSFGSLAHLVLERFGTSREVASADPVLVERKLSRLLDEAMQERYGRRPLPAVRVQGELLRVRLRHFARWQADRIAQGWRVECVEQEPEPGVELDVDGEPILLRGKIDRIDHHQETGEWAVLDYKTGEDGKEPDEVHRKGPGQNRRWVDLQLPLYRLLLGGIRRDDGTPVVPLDRQSGVGLGYILLPRRADGVKAAMAGWSPTDLADAEEHAREVVRALRRGVFPFTSGSGVGWSDPFDALLGRTLLPIPGGGDEGSEG